ncbi:MAG: DUF5678 domain-containing protein [Candidatus Nanohaloarchaea archaeon]
MAKEAQNNQNYFLENEKRLRLNHPDEFIAIANQEVIASGQTHEEVIEEVKKDTPHSTEEVLVKFVRTGRKVVR